MGLDQPEHAAKSWREQGQGLGMVSDLHVHLHLQVVSDPGLSSCADWQPIRFLSFVPETKWQASFDAVKS
jgi:hypothetical protein